MSFAKSATESTPLLKKKDDPLSSPPEEKPPPPVKLSINQLFSYATGLDYFLMIFGTICALLNGATLPLVMKVFGDTVSVFSDFVLISENSSISHDSQEYKDAASHMMDEAQNKCIMFGSLALLALFLGYFQYACWMISGERQSRRIREEYLKGILRQNIGWFDSQKTGELTTRVVAETLQVQEAMGEKCGQVFQYLSTFLTGFILAFLNGWRLALVLISIIPVLSVCAGVMGYLFMNLTKKTQEAYSQAGVIAEDVLSSVRTVAAFSMENKIAALYTQNLHVAELSGIKKGFVSGFGLGFTMLVIFSSYALAFWYGGKLIDQNKMTPGDVLQTFFCIMIGAFSIGQTSPSLTAIGEGRAVAYKIFQVVNRVPPIDSFSKDGFFPQSCQGNVEFRSVTFTYPTREELTIVRDLSFQVPAGQTVALVGSSGCGKSTVMSLLERFYDPLSGAVLLDGQDIRDLNLHWLRSQIGIVRQEPNLFNRTIAENIAYGAEGHCTDDEIVKAAKKANAHDFIMSLPNQYNTNCGEQGTQMSGGQKQRIAIARALVRNPKILLLDEATSALDSQSERIVQDSLDKARHGRTTLVIAHRLSTIRDADKICVIGLGENGGGRVIEQGSHQELMDLQGMYYSMVLAQEMNSREEDHVALNTAQVFNHNTSGPINPGGSAKDFHLKRSGDGFKSKEDEKEEPVPDVSFYEVAKYNSPEWFIIIVGLIAASINGITNPAFSFIFSQLTNVFTKVGTDDFQEELRLWCFLFIGLGVLTGTVNFLQISMFTLAGEKLTTRLRDLSFRSIIRQDISFFDESKNSVGALTTRLSTDATLVQGMLGIRLGSMLQSIVNLVAGLGIAFYYSWKMTLVVLSIMPFLVLSGFLNMKRMKGFDNQARTFYERAGTVACEAIENIRTVVVLNKEQTFLKLFCDNLVAPFKAGIWRANSAGLSIGISQMFMFGAYGFSFYWGAWLLERDQISYLHMMTVFSAVVFTAMALGQISSLSPDVNKARVAAAHMLSLIKSVPSLDTQSDFIGVRPMNNQIDGSVHLENVAFKYPSRPDMTIFEDMSLDVPSNSTVALVGESGCGKSTIIGLLERFYEPISGQVKIDNYLLRELNVKWLRQNIGLVSQEPLLFSTTIRENIRHGKDDATESEIIFAAQSSYAHDFIMGFPNGYDTQVGGKGVQLSGGQKQRIAIARALVRNPKILLLDEATSALDTTSEKIVQEALDRARVGRTTIVIAHRLSTIQNADVIIVLKSGKVVEQGTHSELMNNMGLYYSLVRNQQNM